MQPIVPPARDGRFIPLEGTHNCRAVHSWRTAQGKWVKPGFLYRSSGLEDLTPEDAAALADLGIALVVDLRSDHERARYASDWQGNAPPPNWSGAHCVAAADMATLIQGPPLGMAELHEALLAVYRSFPLDLAGALSAVFDALLEGRGPVLVHCAAGKDRTGFVVAMALRALGVSEEDVMSEYLLTNQVFEEARRRFEKRAHIAALERHTPGATRILLGASSEYLAAADAEISAQWGSAQNYLQAMTGLDGAKRADLCAKFLEG
jgi:protein-tyrosine phosphatase